MDTSNVVQLAEAVERDLARLRATCPHPYSRIERAENILVADLIHPSLLE
jgi:hypothetical protein